MREYDEVIETIENARRFGKQPGVVTAAEALRQMEEPMEGLDYIHVAGTNGKGSVCAFLTAMLREAGLRVGTFTSPHLVDFGERIRVDGEKISREDIRRLGSRLLDRDFGVSLTMFDYCLLMAVLYFREKCCDVAVMETGLGGRLDATNALGTPKTAVITRIGLDHTAILGETLSAIAGEKAGIIKLGCPVISAPQEEEALRVIREKVDDTPGATLTVVSPQDMEAVAALSLRMRGSYQWENGAVAWRAAECYLSCRERAGRGPAPRAQASGSKVDSEPAPRAQASGPEAEFEPAPRAQAWGAAAYSPSASVPSPLLVRGLEQAFWPGRMELISQEPFLLVDGAHNPQGVCALAESLRTSWPGQRFHFIMGVLADKDYAHMIAPLLPLALNVVTVTPESSRALQAEELAAVLRGQGVSAGSVPSLRQALEELPRGEKTVAFGSLYFIGEIKGNYGL